MSKFAIHDRVRVKFGMSRGCYGTVMHVGGDDGTYYGVKLDTHAEQVGYSEYELSPAEPRHRPLWQRNGDKDTRGIYVPKCIAVCPECGGEIQARSMEWEADTGRPVATGIELDCVDYLIHEGGHSFAQDKWQPVRDAVAKWCGARVDYLR